MADPALVPDDRELALCIACCRWPMDGPAQALVRERADSVDWSRFAAIVRRHRVEGLAWRALKAAAVPMPDDARERLAAASRNAAAHNFLTIVECGRLQRSFADAGIALLFLKGLTLAALAYGDPAVKKGWDIDLLIGPRDVDRAAGLLETLGYRLTEPRAGRGTLSNWHRRHKESVWHAPDRGFHVELHTGLTDHPSLLPSVGMGSPVRNVDVGGGTLLPTLCPDALFAYLAVHGASSAWFRLKWLADFSALLAPAGPAEVERLYRRAEELGAARAPALALLLADQLFGLDLPTALRAKVQSQRQVQRMADRALSLMQGRTAIADPVDVRFGTFAIHATQFALRRSWRYKADLLRERLFR